MVLHFNESQAPQCLANPPSGLHSPSGFVRVLDREFLIPAHPLRAPLESRCAKRAAQKQKRRPSQRAPLKLKIYKLAVESSLRLLFFRRLLSRSGRLWRRCRRRRLRTRHAFLESAHAFSQSAHQLRNLASPEKYENDDRNDQQMHWAVPHRTPTFHAGINESVRRGFTLHASKV
jgi:hypothetical protein